MQPSHLGTRVQFKPIFQNPFCHEINSTGCANPSQPYHVKCHATSPSAPAVTSFHAEMLLHCCLSPSSLSSVPLPQVMCRTFCLAPTQSLEVFRKALVEQHVILHTHPSVTNSVSDSIESMLCHAYAPPPPQVMCRTLCLAPTLTAA